MRHPPKTLLVLAGLALMPGGSQAQTVTGQVVDEATAAPVSDVAVTLLDSAGVAVGHQTTQGDGRFSLAAPGPGKYRLRFQVPGYRLLVTPLLELLAGEELSYPLTLRPLPPAVLDTLLVEGKPVPWNLVGFYQRKQRGLGNYVTRDEWERRGQFEVATVVRQSYPPVLQPNCGRGTRLSGIGVVSVFLDGALLNTLDAAVAAEFLNDQSLYHLDAIEIYHSPGIPPEFERPFGACGAIAMWTNLQNTGRTAHLDLGAHVGTAMAGAEGGRGRLGIQAALGLGRLIELYGAFSAIVSAVDPNSVLPRSGWEVIGALRARPLGGGHGWYVGLGGRAGGLRETSAARSTEEQDFVILSGLELPVGRWRPFVELQVLGPQSPASALITGFVGVNARIY